MRTILLLCILLTTSNLFASPKLKPHKVDGIPGEYLVVLADQAPGMKVKQEAKSLAKDYDAEVLLVWDNAFNGFSCRATEANAARMADDPRVGFIEQEHQTGPPQISGMQWTWHNLEYLWHLDRIDDYNWATEAPDHKHYMCTEGRGAVAYVIDTGVQANHPQFETPTRVVATLDFSADRTNQLVPYTTDVTAACTATGFAYGGLWHGTAVASVLGGTQVGVAKPQIISLKIARCHDFQVLASSLISAVDWIGSANDNWRTLPGVINHSGFVPQWTNPNYVDFSAYSAAVSGSVDRHGKPFFTSADNFSTDACIFAPNPLARTYTKSGKIMSVGGTMMGSGN